MIKLLPFLFSLLLFNLSILGQVGDPVWEDNFNNGQLDLTKWSIETGTGINGDWGTGQLDRATGRVENLSFDNSVPGAEDGCLVITTRKEFFIDRNYTSGRIITAGKSSWGPGHRIAARVFPRDVKYKGQGFAFWMMPDELPQGWDYIMWPQGGEVDIMEYVGSIPYHNLGGVHYAWFWENNQWQSWNHGHQAAYYSYEHQQVPFPSEPGHGGYPPAEDDPFAGSTGFHIYGIDWYDDRMEFFIDENVYHIHYFNDGGAFQVDGQDNFAVINIDKKRVGISEYSNHFEEWHPFGNKMYVILSAGVGGSQYTYGGAIVPEAEFPCSVYIDWLKVYELGATGIASDVVITLNVYPNPVRNKLTVQIDNTKRHTLKIMDVSGKTFIQSIFEQSTEVDLSNLKNGVYLVLVTDGKLTRSKKIVVQ